MSRAKLANISVGDGFPVAVVGTLNLSPESFYPSSVVRGPGEAIGRAQRMLEQGAQIIDVGAMSTRPGSKPIPPELERKRLIPVVRALAKEFEAPISVDTQRAEIAGLSLEAGAQIINDVSGFKTDPRMARVIADFGCSVVLMAAKRKPGDARTISEITRALRESLRICDRYDIDRRRVVIDPGIGFDKGVKYDLRILANLEKLKGLRRPICVAVSRKSFIGQVLNLPDPAGRLWGSLAATTVAVLNGASVIRTHDPRETSHVIRVVEAIGRAR